MRRDALYLQDILEAADTIAEFVTGVGEEQFVASRLLQSAVLQQLTVVGEAAARLSPELRGRHPSIEWADIVGFRNIAVHAYFSVQWPIVWVTATEDLPGLRIQIEEVVSSEAVRGSGGEES